jgi:hypothetical protein
MIAAGVSPITIAQMLVESRFGGQQPHASSTLQEDDEFKKAWLDSSHVVGFLGMF